MSSNSVDKSGGEAGMSLLLFAVPVPVPCIDRICDVSNLTFAQGLEMMAAEVVVEGEVPEGANKNQV